MNKSELRIWAKKIRKTLDIESISSDICRNIRELDIYKKSRNIMIFYPLQNEINLLALLDDNKNFYLPRVEGSDLLACPYKKEDKLIQSDLKIMEPLTEPINKSVLDIVFTPALCVDKHFYRLGYGGGFYDRFGVNNKFKIISVIPKELIINELPIETYDVPCEGIITQKKASFLRG